MIENPVVNDDPRLTLKIMQLTTQARRAHVRAYQASGDSMIAYCEKNHLALSTFKAWVAKYGERKISPGFIPIISKNTSSSENESAVFRNIEIHTKNIKIVIPEISDTNLLIKLIQGLSHATHQAERPVCLDL